MKYLILLLTSGFLVGCNGSGGGSAAGGTATSAPVTVFTPATVLGNCNDNNLMVFGDSHAAGGFIDAAEVNSKPVLFSELLANEIGFCLENNAVAGTELYQQLAKIKVLGTKHTKLKLFMVGFNDTTHSDISAARINQFKQDLAEALTILSASSDYVLIGTPPKRMFQLDTCPEYYTEVFADAVIDVAQNFSNVHVVDITRQYNYGAAQIVADHLHFNRAGATQIKDLFLEEFTRL